MKECRYLSFFVALCLFVSISIAAVTATYVPAPYQSVDVEWPDEEISVGETIRLFMTGAVSWTSSDERVATVDSTGSVTGLSQGKVTITATTATGIKANFEIRVK